MENNSTSTQVPSSTPNYTSQSSNYISFDSTPRKQNFNQQKQHNKYRPYNNQWNSNRKANNSNNRVAFQRETPNTEQFTPRQFSSPMNPPPFYRNNKRPFQYQGGRKFFHDNGGDGGSGTNFRNDTQNHHKQHQVIIAKIE